jgi:type 1 glutamine amidotransferase
MGLEDFAMTNSASKTTTRRSAMKAMLALPAAVYGRRAATAFALAGDRYHNVDYIRTALGKTLVRDLGITIDFSDELSLLDSKYLSDYKLLIMLRDGMVWPGGYAQDNASRKIASDPPLAAMESTAVYWITAEQGKAVKQFVQNGGGALFYHNTTYISPHNEDFRDVLGAVTQGHPPLRPFKVKITNKEHPITRGVSDFVVTDEQHFMTYEKDAKYLLMQSVNEDGLTWKDLGASSAAGWAYDYGKGRVCYLAPGHLITALWNPEYEKIQKNAVKWLLRETQRSRAGSGGPEHQPGGRSAAGKRLRQRPH